jgi:hypothetical protein
MGSRSGLVLMLLDPQKASLAVLWPTEWYFGMSAHAGLSAMPF